MLKEQLATEDQYAISITDIPDDQPPSYKSFPNSTPPPPYPTSSGADIHPAGTSALPPPEKSEMAQAVPADQHVPDMESIVNLPPGLCPVCRKGQIIERPTWLTWLLCVLLSPCLIVPGVLAFFFCCRAPVCDFCHYQF